MTQAVIGVFLGRRNRLGHYVPRFGRHDASSCFCGVEFRVDGICEKRVSCLQYYHTVVLCDVVLRQVSNHLALALSFHNNTALPSVWPTFRHVLPRILPASAADVHFALAWQTYGMGLPLALTALAKLKPTSLRHLNSCKVWTYADEE